jgi:hypothetical protein
MGLGQAGETAGEMRAQLSSLAANKVWRRQTGAGLVQEEGRARRCGSMHVAVVENLRSSKPL